MEEIEYLIAILSDEHRKINKTCYTCIAFFIPRGVERETFREYKRATLPDGRETVAAIHTALQLESSATNVKIM